jgi:hypothetical protein
MHEPAPTIATAGGLLIFGFATGLHPGLILAGAIGCWLTLMIAELDFNRAQRAILVFIAGITASWFAPACSSVLGAYAVLPVAVDYSKLEFSIAATFGFVLVPVLAPAVLRIGKKKMEDLGGG